MEFKRKTPQQLQALDTLYSEDEYPTQNALEEYAATLGLTYKQVHGWFVQKRRRDERENGMKVTSNVAETHIPKYKYETMVDSQIRERKKKLGAIQSSLSPNNVSTKVFCKDGPSLGADFDYLPSGACFHHKGIRKVTSFADDLFSN